MINGKKGATKKKLLCKCGASGKCKWKNEKNKKINKLTYQKWKCVGDAVEKPTEEKPTEEKPTGDDDKPTGGNTGGGSEVIPSADGRPRILAAASRHLPLPIRTRPTDRPQG